MKSRRRRTAKRRRFPPPGSPDAARPPDPVPHVPPPLPLPRRGAGAVARPETPSDPSDLSDHQPDLGTLHRVLAGLRGLS